MRRTIVFEAVTGSLGESISLTREQAAEASRGVIFALELAARLSKRLNSTVMVASTDDVLNGLVIITGRGGTMLCGLELGVISECDPVFSTAMWPDKARIRAFRVDEGDLTGAVPRRNSKTRRKTAKGMIPV